MSTVRSIATLAFVLVSASATGQPWYVASNGSDTNTGSEQSPFKSIEKAVSVVQPGEIIYVRGGTYNLLTTITLGKSGTENSPISLFAYPGEWPVLDFSAQTLDAANRGIILSGNYWHIKGISITGAGDNGMKIEAGHNNTIETCAFYRNRDSGLQIDNGASDNRILNCDSYFNADPPDYGDADGFAPKLTVGSGNYFYGCRAWRNCDDGWDGYLRGTDDPTTTLENCWTFENGYLENGTDPGIYANGNGFKMGGSDDKTLRHNFTLKNCLAFRNKAKGFDQNNNKGSMKLYNCSGYGNLVSDYRINQALADGKVLIIKNCVVFGKAEIGVFAEQACNSWLSPFIVTADDFISLDWLTASGPRKADGSLPDILFMHLAPGSDLIDAGVDVGLPYYGPGPDIGCFENYATSTHNYYPVPKTRFYPDPVTENATLELVADRPGRCIISLFDITGRNIKTLADRQIDAGVQHFNFFLSDLANGVYFYRITIDRNQVLISKFIKATAAR